MTRWFIVACLCPLLTAAAGDGHRRAHVSTKAPEARPSAAATLEKNPYRPPVGSGPPHQATIEWFQGSAADSRPRAGGTAPRGVILRASLWGSIGDQHGRPLVGARLAVETEDGHWETRSTPDGVFHIDGVVPGPAVVTASMHGFESVTRSVAVLAARPTELHLQMRRSISLSGVRGRVLSPGGVPLRATATAYPLRRRSLTNARGDFEMILEPGTYSVRVRSYGYRSRSFAVQVEPGHTSTLDAVLYRAQLTP